MGDDYALPVVGNFDPPVAGGPAPAYTYYSYTNPEDPVDVNGDGHRTPMDALLLVNMMNLEGPHELVTFRSEAIGEAPWIDPTGDMIVDPNDIVRVINGINEGGGPASQGEAELTSEIVVAAARPVVQRADVFPATDDPGTASLIVGLATRPASVTLHSESVLVSNEVAASQPGTEVYSRPQASTDQTAAMPALTSAIADEFEIDDDLAEDVATAWLE
jgi:hypothetical protein